MELFEQWNLGYMVLLLPLFLVVMYLVVRQLRRLAAWVDRNESPKERVGAYIVILIIIGVLSGGVFQRPVELGFACNDANRPIMPCVIEYL